MPKGKQHSLFKNIIDCFFCSLEPESAETDPVFCFMYFSSDVLEMYLVRIQNKWKYWLCSSYRILWRTVFVIVGRYQHCLEHGSLEPDFSDFCFTTCQLCDVDEIFNLSVLCILLDSVGIRIEPT